MAKDTGLDEEGGRNMCTVLESKRTPMIDRETVQDLEESVLRTR